VKATVRMMVGLQRLGPGPIRQGRTKRGSGHNGSWTTVLAATVAPGAPLQQRDRDATTGADW
jgi:hypothetical protein